MVEMTLLAFRITATIFMWTVAILWYGVKWLDIAFLEWLLFYAPRVENVFGLDVLYSVSDKLTQLFGKKIIAFAVTVGAMYLLYAIFTLLAKKFGKMDLSEVLKYVIALPVCLIFSMGLYAYSQMITTSDAAAARVFFYVVIVLFDFNHYGNFLYHDIKEGRFRNLLRNKRGA